MSVPEKIEAAIRASVVPELEEQARQIGDTFLQDFRAVLKGTSQEAVARISAHARRAAQFRLEAALEPNQEKAQELLEAAETAMRAVRVAVSAEGIVASERSAALIENALRKAAEVLGKCAEIAVKVAVGAAVAAI